MNQHCHNILTNQFKNRQDTGKGYRDMGQTMSKSLVKADRSDRLTTTPLLVCPSKADSTETDIWSAKSLENHPIIWSKMAAYL